MSKPHKKRQDSFFEKSVFMFIVMVLFVAPIYGLHLLMKDDATKHPLGLFLLLLGGIFWIGAAINS